MGNGLTPVQRKILEQIEIAGAVFFSKDTSDDYLAAARVWLERLRHD